MQKANGPKCRLSNFWLLLLLALANGQFVASSARFARANSAISKLNLLSCLLLKRVAVDFHGKHQFAVARRVRLGAFVRLESFVASKSAHTIQLACYESTSCDAKSSTSVSNSSSSTSSLLFFFNSSSSSSSSFAASANVALFAPQQNKLAAAFTRYWQPA